jgi:cobalt-zinc-cadmium efflux system protein
MNRQTNHHHHHHAAPMNRAFGFGVLLNLVYVAIEAGYGFYADSLALVTDAGHNLSDVLCLLLAWGASWMAARKANEKHTYGYSRATILASLLSALLLILVVGAIVWEAVSRINNPVPTPGKILIIVAGVGVLINTGTALLFLRGKDHDLNIRGAYLHMAADAAVSLGVVVAGVVILQTGWQWVDPAVSLLIAAVIFYSTWGLLRDSIKLTFDGVPAHIELSKVRKYLLNVSGVMDVHDLHVWAMSTSETALTAHLVMAEMPISDAVLTQINSELDEQFNISHSTLQIEMTQQHTCPDH